MTGWRLGILVLALLVAPRDALGQAVESPRPFAWDLARAVLIDPTTYAPAVITHEAMSGDWKTSQVFFAHGWVERNPQFTISGLPNDRPVSYEAGTRIITRESLKVFQYSLVNNAAAGIAERLLIQKYPGQRRLIRTLSWIERIGFASFVTYTKAGAHIRQSRENRRLARAYGYSR